MCRGTAEPELAQTATVSTTSSINFFPGEFDFVENPAAAAEQRRAAAVLTLRAAENEPAGASSVTVCVSITDNICVVAIGWGRTIFRPSTLAW